MKSRRPSAEYFSHSAKRVQVEVLDMHPEGVVQGLVSTPHGFVWIDGRLKRLFDGVEPFMRMLIIVGGRRHGTIIHNPPRTRRGIVREAAAFARMKGAGRPW